MALTDEQVMSVKGRGFLRNRGTDNFSGRVVSVGGVYDTAALKALSECAERFGNGKVIMTSRLSAEIPGIPFEKIARFIEKNTFSSVHIFFGVNIIFTFIGCAIFYLITHFIIKKKLNLE